jgi:hypothetical protein
MTYNDRLHDVAQTNHTDQLAWLWVIPALHHHQPMHSSRLDQAKDRAERVSRLAGDDSWEVASALLERLRHVQVQCLEGTIAN